MVRELTLGLLLLSCTHNLARISKQYETLEGRLAAPPQLEAKGKRLFLYLHQPSELVVCIVRNRENREILAELRALIERGGEAPLSLYASQVNGPIEEILGGVDYEVHAVAVYIPEAKRYRVILSGYGDSLIGAMSSLSWKEFLQRVVGQGVEKAL